MTAKLSIEQIISAVAAGDNNALFDNAPEQPVSLKAVEVQVVGKRCVYVNNYRIAGAKPYVSENLPSYDLKTTLGDVLDAFRHADILAAIAESNARREYFAAYHAAKKNMAEVAL